MKIQDVHNAIRDVNINGSRTGDIEAFVIHTDDLHEILKHEDEKGRFHPELTGYNPGIEDGMKLLGVKIIESPYTVKGTIFKIMKNNQKQYAHPIDEMGNLGMPGQHYSPTVPGSGIIPGWKNPIIGGLKKPDYLPDMTDDKKEEEPEKRHSDKRRIELD